MMRSNGFTLVEMLVALALVSIAAAVMFPYAALVETRAKEAELRIALRAVRRAIDEYKAASDAGLIERRTGASGFPPNLDVLATGAPRSGDSGHGAPRLVFLRAVPRDPFHSDRNVSPSATWSVRSYGASPGDFSPGEDVYDISSRSERTALDGSLHADW